MHVFTQLSICKKATDMIKILLDEMKNLISFSKCSIFAFSIDIKEGLELVTPEKDGIYVFKTFIEGGKNITGVQK